MSCDSPLWLVPAALIPLMLAIVFMVGAVVTFPTSPVKAALYAAAAIASAAAAYLAVCGAESRGKHCA